MAIGRISGQMLKANLLRSGVDLAFETNLLVLDVSNNFVGVGTATPSRQLHIAGTGALRLPGGTSAERGTAAAGDMRYNSDNSTIEGYAGGEWKNLASGTSLKDTDGNTGIDAERTADQNEIHFFTEASGDVAHIRDNGTFEINNLAINDLTISSLTTNGNISISPNGTGSVVIGKADINGGAIDGATIGAASAAAGTFTTGIFADVQSGTVKANDGTTAITIANTTGRVTFGENVIVTGDLTVNGTTTSVNSTTVDITDLNITVASGAANSAAANGAGITVDGANATMLYVSSSDTWDFNKNVKATFEGNITGALTGNADTVTNGVYTTDTATVTNTMLAGSIANDKLTNSATTIGSTSVSLGATATTLAGLTSVSSTGFTATNVQATNIKANDGTAAITIADSTGRATFSENVIVSGDLTVNGTTTSVNSTTVDIADLNITVAKGASDAATANGAGLTVDGANATMLYVSSTDSWDFNKAVISTNGFTGALTGNVTGNVTGALTGNADTVTNGVYTTDTATVTNTMLAGSIANDKLAGSIANDKLSNSAVTIGSTSVSLGATETTIAGLTSVSSTGFTATNVQATNIKANDGTAAITIADSTGNVQAQADLAVVGGLTVGGNLQVNGTTTTINSSTLTIEDPMIQLAKNNSGGDANTFDQGLFMNRGSDDNVSFLWDESADEFVVAVTAGENGSTAGNVTIDSYANFKAGNITATNFYGDGSNLTGIDATAIQNGTTNVQTAANDDVTITRAETLHSTFDETGIVLNTGNFIGALTGNADTVTNGVYTTDTATVTNTMLAGSIANAKLSNSAVTIGSTSLSLGATATTIAGLESVTSTGFTGNVTGIIDGSGNTTAFNLPVGSTEQRPSAATGVIRFNSTTGTYEGSADGSTWQQFPLGTGDVSINKATATGDGSSSTFSGFFSQAPAGANNVMVFIDNVYQEATENYTVSGTNITFASAPHSGARIFAMEGFDNTAVLTGGVARTLTEAVSFESSATTIMNFNASDYRSAELYVQITDTANGEYSCMKAQVIHDGSTAYIVTYGVLNTSGADTATLTAEYNSGTVNVQAISTGGASTAKVQYSLMAL